MYGPMDFAKTLKLRFRGGDLSLQDRRKRYTGSREEEEAEAQMCPHGKAVKSGAHRRGECDLYKEERDLLEREIIDERDMDEFGTLESSETTNAILGDR